MTSSCMKIFLSHTRLSAEQPGRRMLETLPGDTRCCLHSLKEVTLDVDAQLSFSVTGEEQLLVIPLAGDTCVLDGLDIEAGTISILSSENIVLIGNRSKVLCQFLLLRMSKDSSGKGIRNVGFNLPQNQLLELYSENDMALLLCCMDGRRELSLSLKGQSCFGYVISGAFEMNGAPLERGDGFLLSEMELVRWVAFSEDALRILSLFGMAGPLLERADTHLRSQTEPAAWDAFSQDVLLFLFLS
jgi:hypothetical protein